MSYGNVSVPGCGFCCNQNRDHRIDTIKGILIILVVFGHLLEPFLTDRVNIIVYNLIYSFHMPLFIIISGYLFKPGQKIEKLKTSSLKLTETFIVYFFIYQFLRWIEYAPLTYNDLISPPYIMWYLWALIIWRILGYLIFGNYKCDTLSLFIALCVALIAGVLPLKNELSIQRILSFAFFFVIGLYMQTNRIKLNRIVLLALIPVLIIGCYLLIKSEGRNVDELRWFFYYNRPYTTFCDVFLRLFVLLLGFSISMVMWSLIRSNIVLAKIGSSTLPIYLLHLLPVKCYAYLAKAYHLPHDIGTLVVVSFCIVYSIYLVSQIKQFGIVLNPISFGMKSIMKYRSGAVS